MRFRRALAVAAALALCASAAADAATRRLLVNGDSLAVGTQPYLPRELSRWRVTQSTAISRHAFEGAAVMRAYGRGVAPAREPPRGQLGADGSREPALAGRRRRARAVARSVRRCD